MSTDSGDQLRKPDPTGIFDRPGPDYSADDLLVSDTSFAAGYTDTLYSINPVRNRCDGLSMRL